MAKLVKCGILLQTGRHNWKGQSGVTVTSKSQPPMVLLSHSRTHTYTQTHTGARTTMPPRHFPWLDCMAGSFLPECRAVALRKGLAPTAQKVRNITSIYIPASRPLLPSASRTPHGSVSLSEVSDSHSRQHVRAGEHTWLHTFVNSGLFPRLNFSVCFYLKHRETQLQSHKSLRVSFCVCLVHIYRVMLFIKYGGCFFQAK